MNEREIFPNPGNSPSRTVGLGDLTLGDRARGGPGGVYRPFILAGATLALGVLTALSTGPAPAQAAFPGLNGLLGCEGRRGPAVPDPNPEKINRTEVFTINPDGTDEKVLTDNRYRDGDPSFSPDGKNIAFESFQPGFSEAFRMTTEGTAVTRLTFSGDNEDRSTNWSPDGTKIAFHSTRDRATIPSPGSPFEIYTMNADGSNQTRITDNIAQDSFPQYSPDGKKLVFTSNRDEGDFEIYTMNPDGTDPVRLTNSPGEDAHPTWSPDGSQITFHSRREDGLRVWKMNADGSNPTRLTKTPDTFEYFPVWSPDGTRIAYNGTTQNPDDVDVYTMSAVDGSDVQRVTSTPGFDGRCDWQTIPRAAQNPPAGGGGNPPAGGGGGNPPAGGGGGSSVPPKATVCANSKGVKVLGTTNSGGRVFQGSKGDDRICGTNAGDVITGNGGRDVISGGGGNDRINGGSGSDRINGGSGKDRISGSSGNDVISGSSGNDRINGNSGDDRINGNSGDDRLAGASGNDVISGSSGKDVISGGSGSDRLSGGSGNDRINGDSGNDRISGGSGGDRLKGSSGNDRIDGGPGKDRISGGSGKDKIKQ